jgi:hypothetical protein
MMDLFGDTITQPECAGLKRRLLNAAHGFPEFWKAYPPGPRKVAKKQCLDKWARLECAEQASHILAHVEWMKTQPDWTKDGGAFICAPLVYLNQQRWEGWEPPPVVPKKPDALAEIKAHKGAPMPENVRAKLDELRGKR